MSKPKLAIVGRPNVGKSALFNRICRKRIAIVDEAEGITRDRLYADAEHFGIEFEIIDTGGIDIKSQAPFNEQIKRQAEIAIEEADTIIMVVDSRIGITELDQEVSKILLKTNKPLCLAVNKIDNHDQAIRIYPFYKLGIEKVVGVSATQGFQVAELLDIALAGLEVKPEEEINPRIKISIVGRANVGKSTFINYLLQEQRCIVSPIAGTTRDSIDVDFDWQGKEYTLIDTAGIRRKGAEHEVVDKFAAIRTEKAIKRSDICLLILDANQGLTTQEKRIANMIEEAGKSCILLFNKWDLVKGFRMEHCLQAVQQENPFLAYCPVLFMSALTGRNLDKLFPMIEQVYAETYKRVTTHQLNKFLERSIQLNHPPMLGGKRLRIYYMAQVDVAPPKFILFVNHHTLMVESYRKYLINNFRKQYHFTGVPIVIHMKSKEKKEAPPERPKSPEEMFDRELPEADIGEEDFDEIDGFDEFDELEEAEATFD